MLANIKREYPNSEELNSNPNSWIFNAKSFGKKKLKGLRPYDFKIFNPCDSLINVFTWRSFGQVDRSDDEKDLKAKNGRSEKKVDQVGDGRRSRKTFRNVEDAEGRQQDLAQQGQGGVGSAEAKVGSDVDNVVVVKGHLLCVSCRLAETDNWQPKITLLCLV